MGQGWCKIDCGLDLQNLKNSCVRTFVNVRFLRKSDYGQISPGTWIIQSTVQFRVQHFPFTCHDVISPSPPFSLLQLSFCPALTVMSSVLRLSQNVAGVTLLALGNGAPDIFSAYAAVNQAEDEKASLAVGALFGI